MPNLNNRLKDSRLKLGLSQHEVAALCGVSQPTIANWERGGHIPRRAALEKLSQSLGVDKDWLLSGHHPVEAQAAHIHLSKPIHHIPVYIWPKTHEQLTQAQPTEYITLSLEAGDYFAMHAPDSHHYDDKTILIFNRSGRATGTHLVVADDGLKLSDPASASEVLGRLVYSLKSYE